MRFRTHIQHGLAFLAVPLLAGLTLAGCGSSKPAAATDTSSANASVTATGSFGKAPAVTIPKTKAGKNLAYKTVIPGTGTTLTSTDYFLGNYVVYAWTGTTHSLKASTYTSVPTLFTTPLIPGLAKAMTGAKVGSRVLAVIPPADAFGTKGNSEAGISGTTTLVFVIDVLKAYAANASATGTQVSAGAGLPTVSDTTGAAPTITIPSGTAAPKDLVTKTLITGTGAKVTSGQDVLVQYTGVIWRTGKVFDSSWSRKEPTEFTLSTSSLIPGMVTGLVGQTVGSRVLIVIPPAEGYGKSGNSEIGLKGTDDMVFVVDIIDAFSAPAAS
jgi:peptidylprolyl isomerase